MSSILQKIAAWGAASLLAGTGLNTSAYALQFVDPAEALEAYLLQECASGMESTPLQSAQNNHYIFYECIFSQGFGCIEGQTCPPQKCKGTFMAAPWRAVGRTTSPVTRYTCYIVQ